MPSSWRENVNPHRLFAGRFRMQKPQRDASSALMHPMAQLITKAQEVRNFQPNVAYWHADLRSRDGQCVEQCCNTRDASRPGHFPAGRRLQRVSQLLLGVGLVQSLGSQALPAAEGPRTLLR